MTVHHYRIVIARSQHIKFTDGGRLVLTSVDLGRPVYVINIAHFRRAIIKVSFRLLDQIEPVFYWLLSWLKMTNTVGIGRKKALGRRGQSIPFHHSNLPFHSIVPFH